MEVIHDPVNQEFKIELDKASSEKAYLTYELKGDTIEFKKTFVPPNYAGQGIAEKLVRGGLNFVDNESSIKTIIPSCAYVAKFLNTKAPQYAPYLPK